MRSPNVHLTATIKKDEIVQLISELTPLKIDLGRKRNVSFGTPELVELVPDTGLRIRGGAKMIWEVAGLPLPVTLRTWQVLLTPSIEQRDGALVLAFEPVIEDLDFKRVPGFFDERIVDAINEGVASQRRKLCWNLTRLLGSSSPMPARVSPGGTFDIAPSAVTVRVTAAELRVDIDFAAQLAQEAAATPRSLRAG